MHAFRGYALSFRLRFGIGEIRGHCKVEIPVTHFCVIKLPDVVSRVSGSIGMRERNR